MVIEKLPIKGNPYAAFDLDNTLLIGDIGEAVFAYLLKKHLIRNFSWDDYLQLLAKNKLRAYKNIINLMQGLKLTTIEAVTYEVLNHKNSIIAPGSYKIPVPKPNLFMSGVVEILREKGLDIYVVTASNEVSARIICRKYFNMPASHIIGAEVPHDKSGIILKSSKEFPYGKGKVNILKKRFKNKPLVTGGDSPGDRYLLNYAAKEGIGFWLGT